MTTWTKRQLDIVDNWYNRYNARGLLIAYTAFGKSSGIAIPAIKKVNPKKLIITVPKRKLKEDWEVKLKANKLKGEVIVVNTLIKNTYDCDLLIVDEVHRYAADTFAKTFEVVKYDKLLCLTASLERQDGRHEVIKKVCPIIDKVTIEEGLEEGWVDPFKVIKIPITLTKGEQTKLDKINNTYEYLRDEMGFGNPLKNAAFHIRYLDLRKWVVGNKSRKVFFKKTIKDSLPNTLTDKQFDRLLYKRFHSPDKEHPQYKLALIAKRFYKTVSDRKKLLYNAKNKIVESLKLIDEYQDEYKFVFAQRIEFLEVLAEHLPKDEYSIYHSKLTPKRQAEEFRKFNDGRTKIKTMLSVKSLIEGIDIPKLVVSIITSFTASSIDKIQTWGRTMRKYKDKKATIIYLYIPDTQEEIWLNNIL